MTTTMPELTARLRHPHDLPLGSVLADYEDRPMVTGVHQLANGHVAVFLNGDDAPSFTMPGDQQLAVEQLASRPSDSAQAAMRVMMREVEELARIETEREAARERATRPVTPPELPVGPPVHPQVGKRRILPWGDVIHVLYGDVPDEPPDGVTTQLQANCGITRPMPDWLKPDRHPEPERLRDCKRCARRGDSA